MKEIVIFTMGTRGDVQPYIYLAKALLQEGLKPVIGTHPCWRDLVSETGLEFVPIGPDIDIEYEAAVIRGKTKSPILSMLKTMQFVFRIIQSSSRDIYDACKGKDLAIISHSHMGAAEAEALNIKTIDVTLQTEMLPRENTDPTLKDKVLGALINPQVVKPYNKIRKLYDLPPIKSMDQMMSKELNLIPISRYIAEPNPNWAKRNAVVGYWFAPEDNYQPSEELKSFLNEGSKPVILALGAMSFESRQEKEKLDIFVKAFEQTEMRAIIQGFNKTLTDYQLPESMIRVGSIPHSWLFKQGCCVIHHCGFGTSASSMIYGIPSIPVPHVLDQFAFAEHIYRLKAGVRPIKAKELSTNRLIEAIDELNADYAQIYQNVTDLSKKMQAENGLEKSVQLIRNIV